MKPVCAPVRGLVRAMSPYSTYFLTAQRLPYILTIFYVLSCKQYCTIRFDNLFRHRRSLSVDLSAKIKQNEKRDYHNGYKAEPKFSCCHDYFSFNAFGYKILFSRWT